MPQTPPLMEHPSAGSTLFDPAIAARLFDLSEIADGISLQLREKERQLFWNGRINDTDFSLTIDLSGAAGHTSPEQIAVAAKLFWYCYPQMYARFGLSDTPTRVTLRIENFGYGIAEAWDDQVHIHDCWLMENPTDFDCLTHEFAHTVQSDWQDGYMPIHEDDTYMVERFADYCRYLYAFENGRYNDTGWDLQTPEREGNPFDSVRFWVWLDYTYSTADRDIIREMNRCIHQRSEAYGEAAWAPDGSAWQAVFAGTGAAGKDLFALWEEYLASGIAYLSSGVAKEEAVSPLLQAFPLREAIRDRYADARSYLNTM